MSPKFGTLNRSKLVTFSIHLDPPLTVYTSGRTLSGYVLLELKGSMEMRGIYIKLTGKVHTEWKTTKKKVNETEVR